MILKVIFGQRKENYQGQHAPEALDIATEYDYEENPDWLNNRLTEWKTHSHFTSVKIVDIKVDGDELYDLLVKYPVITGSVQK